MIDFLRGFSIFTIVAMHYLQSDSLPGMVNKVLSIGGTGVHIFFICSGFGLYLSYLNHPVGYKEFIGKRFVKIYIPYVIVVGISAALPYMYSGNRLNAFFSHIFLYKMFVPCYEESLGPFWYISTLFQFYFLFAPLAYFREKFKSSKRFVQYCFVISMFWWIITALLGIAEQRIWGSFFLQYLWEFALGMTVAEHLYEGKSIEINTSVMLVMAPLGIGVAGAAKIAGGYWTAFNDVFACFGYGAVALLLFQSSFDWLHTFINYTAKISYEIYLLHMLVFMSIRQLRGNKYLLAVVSFFICYLLADGYSKFTKKICRKLMEKKIYCLTKEYCYP